ncbi:MAG: PDDEXK nuclease domain-containing protein [Lachnospiraceae bacterium]|nr:PDDEXK nuclease domain-containing protein [Lachnospiraceae bacterium]
MGEQISETFFTNVSDILEQAKQNAKAAIDLSMVYAYFEIGRLIVEEEQSGGQRAAYGKYVIPELSKYLTVHMGRGFSVTNLKQMRKFYQVYAEDRIGQTLSDQFANLPAVSTGRKFPLSWSHYLKLMRIDNADQRHFYEIEAAQNHWGLRELQRQFDSALYERLALSRDKDKVMELALKGQVIEKPEDVLKDPYILEFTGLKERAEFSECELESRLLDHLQEFLLELGKGFAFIGRQVRFTFDERHFRVDLVFYNRLLHCFVVIDLKIGELTHQDLGQMQMYVNYYDRYEKTADENPTIGVLLCQQKSDALVELTLPADSNIYASKYELYLPDKKELQEKLREWMAEETGGEES